ncbi:MAG: hypothetical protein FWG01_00985 [Betaproteobacteria bacterium]|nr:hypothetical protein [Betaproteobacteria bacterium]
MIYGLKMIDIVLVMLIVILAIVNIVITVKAPLSSFQPAWKGWAYLAIFLAVALSHLLEGWYLLYGWEPNLMIAIQHFGTAGLLVLWTVSRGKE